MRNVCVIGGSRYFGRHLVELLHAAGISVTVVNRGSTPPPPYATHLVADRDDEGQLRAVLGSRTFDAVIDQVCYSPSQAAVARRVFADRTRRYVMTSTMEVYDPATSPTLGSTTPGVPVTEECVAPDTWPVRFDLPWHEQREVQRLLGPATAYAEGKRQAEAVFTRDPAFEYVTVRSAHVLGGGPQDFTGRLSHYVERITAGCPVEVHHAPLPTSFVHHREIAAFLYWAMTADFVGPVNACSHGELTVTELCELVAERVGAQPRYRTVAEGDEASPFSFDRYYAIDNSRAAGLGFSFSKTTEWLPDAITGALASGAGA